MHHTHQTARSPPRDLHDHSGNHYLDPDPVPQQPKPALRSTRFTPIKLTEARLDAFHDVAHSALSSTVREFVKLDGNAIDTQRWRYVRSRGGASVYYERRRANKHQAALLVAGTIKARLADVMEGLYMDTTEHTRLVQHQLTPRFADAEVLKVIEQRSAEHPFAFTGLKWAMVKPSASGMVSSRDACFLEKVGVIDITGGRKLGYFIMQSVDLPECPPAASSKTLRTSMSLCYLFEETRNGLVGMYMNGTMDLAGPKMLWKMSRTNFADIALSVAGAREVAYAKRCAALMRAKRHASAATHAKQTRGSVCELCHSLPSFFERHRECAGCDKMSVCKKCRVKHDVLRREHKSSLKLAHATFCYDCMESVKNPNPLTASSTFSSSPTGGHARRRDPEHEETDDDDEPPIAPPRGFKPLYDDESPRGYKIYDDIASPRGFHNSESISTTFESGHELFGYDEPEPDSQRSLRMFTLKLQQQLEEVGYDELDASSRHEGLAMLGSGEYGRDSDSLSCTSDDDLTSSSCVSSLLSVETDGVNEEDCGDLEEEEEILSVRPVRRSQQPLEMLEAQTLNVDGTLRKQSSAASSSSTPSCKATSPDELTRALLSRLEEASLVAEQTYEQLKRSQVFSRSSSRAQSTESSGYTL